MKLVDLLREPGIILAFQSKGDPRSPEHSVREKCYKLWMGISFSDKDE